MDGDRLGDRTDLGVHRGTEQDSAVGARPCGRKVLLPVRNGDVSWGAFLRRVRKNSLVRQEQERTISKIWIGCRTTKEGGVKLLLQKRSS